MTNTNAIAINRAKPLFHEAAEKHECIVHRHKQWAEITGELLNEAAGIGRLLEAARLALHDVDVNYDDVLASHAPNISPKQARKYIAHSKGQIDPRQLTMAFIAIDRQLPEESETTRAKAAQWEITWGYAKKLTASLRTQDLATWMDVQLKALRSDLEPVARKLWPDRF